MNTQLERGRAGRTGATGPLPGALDSPRTKLVYLYLATTGPGTVEEVRDALGLELISLYPVLDALGRKGLVDRDGSRYVCSDD